MKKVVIIGGGIIGQFCAYYLSKSGHQVTIVDDNPTMLPASYGNCGLITPSHILPMNSWGLIFQGIKYLGKKDAPLFIKPQLNWPFISWFVRFAMKANRNHIENASAYRHELLQLSWDLYETFFSETSGIEFEKSGLLYTSNSQKGIQGIRHEHEMLERFGLPARMLSSEDVQEMEPTIKTSKGGAIFECDGSLDPTKLMHKLRELNQANGVQFLEAEIELKGAGTKIHADIESDFYVLAAGAKSALLASELGLNLNLIPGKGYNLTSNTPIPNSPKRPIYLFDRKVVLTTWKHGFRLGSTMEFSGYDLSLNEQRLNALKRAASDLLEIDFDQFEFTPWAGWRPMTSDSLPIIQKSKKYSNLIHATGHGMLGLTLAPATGYLVDCLLNEEHHSLHTNRRV